MVKKVNPWWPYLEATAFVALAALINTLAFPQYPAFKGLSFSLLWVPILFIAGRYGTAPSLFASVLSSGYYVYMVSLENFFFGRFEWESDDKVAIFTFLFIGIFLGQMYDRLRNELYITANRYDELKGQFEHLGMHYKTLETANQELEKRIVGRYTTLSSLYEMARDMESLDEQNLYRGVLDLVNRFLHADRACLYLLDLNGDLQLADAIGYPEDEGEKRRLLERGKTHPLIQAALKKDRVVTFRDGFEDQSRGPDENRVWLAGPVFLLNERKTTGVISVDRLPFLAINAANTRILGIIGDWAARAIEKSRAFSDLRARELDDQLTGVYSYSFFSIRFAEEMSRAKRYQLPLTLMLIELADFDRMTPELQQDLLAIVGLVFNHTIRDVDIACRYSNPSTFALILPLTEPMGARVLLKKIHTAIDSYNFKPFAGDRNLQLSLTANTFVGNREGDNPYQIDESVLRKFLAETEAGLKKA